MSALLKIDTQATMMTKAKANAVAAANNEEGSGLYVVRCLNEKMGYFVVDVIEDGEIVFTL